LRIIRARGAPLRALRCSLRSTNATRDDEARIAGDPAIVARAMNRANSASSSVWHHFTDRRITVMGLGQYGGGAGAARYLVERAGARVLVTDRKTNDQLTETARSLADLVSSGRLSLRLGEHVESDFTSCDLVVANPAVPRPWSNPYLEAARRSGVPITTEMRLLIETIPDKTRVVGVTGTAGKSTTTAMIHHILRRAGRSSHLGGNIGGSLLGSTFAQDDVVVLELSSAMLYWLGERIGSDNAPGWSPDVAVLTNLAPNHLDWHETFEHYRESKENIFRHQSSHGCALRGESIDLDAHRAIWDRIDLRLPGAHNRRNALLAALTCASGFDLDPLECAAALDDFHGLPHRLELVHTSSAGCTFYDDSKSTTPEATRLAVEAFDEPARIHLIAGGYDKRIDLRGISDLAPRLAGLYAIGATGRRMVAQAPDDSAAYLGTLDAAVQRAVNRMRPGEVLLLSPGCASWDQFTNFEARGRAFAELVRRLAE